MPWKIILKQNVLITEKMIGELRCDKSTSMYFSDDKKTVVEDIYLVKKDPQNDDNWICKFKLKITNKIYYSQTVYGEKSWSSYDLTLTRGRFRTRSLPFLG